MANSIQNRTEIYRHGIDDFNSSGILEDGSVLVDRDRQSRMQGMRAKEDLAWVGISTSFRAFPISQ